MRLELSLRLNPKAEELLATITAQEGIKREPGGPGLFFTASNGVGLAVCLEPEYRHHPRSYEGVKHEFFLRGSSRAAHNRAFPIPLADWPLISAALLEAREKIGLQCTVNFETKATADALEPVEIDVFTPKPADARALEHRPQYVQVYPTATPTVGAATIERFNGARTAPNGGCLKAVSGGKCGAPTVATINPVNKTCDPWRACREHAAGLVASATWDAPPAGPSAPTHVDGNAYAVRAVDGARTSPGGQCYAVRGSGRCGAPAVATVPFDALGDKFRWRACQKCAANLSDVEWDASQAEKLLICTFNECAYAAPLVPATWRVIKGDPNLKQVGRGACDACVNSTPAWAWDEFAVQRLADGFVRTSKAAPPPVVVNVAAVMAAKAAAAAPPADPRPPQYAGWTVADLCAERDRLAAVVTEIWTEAKAWAAAREECQGRLDAAHAAVRDCKALIEACQKHDGGGS